MSCIVYQTNKKTGVKYAYESISYWDPVKKQPRSKRKYVGKVDPETGEIIYTTKGSTASKPDDSEITRKLRAELEEKNLRINVLEKDLLILSEKYEAMREAIRKLAKQIE